jgi:hypothetical protein
MVILGSNGERCGKLQRFFRVFRGDYGSQSGLCPERFVGEKARDELRMERVSGLIRFHASQKRQADECKIPDQIECFVAAELVSKA